MGVCVECHPSAIRQPVAGDNLKEIEEIAVKMNSNPINRRFTHGENEECEEY